MLFPRGCYCIQQKTNIQSVREAAWRGSLPEVPVELGDPIQTVFFAYDEPLDVARDGTYDFNGTIVRIKNKKVVYIQRSYEIPFSQFPPSQSREYDPNKIRYYKLSYGLLPSYHLYAIDSDNTTTLIISTSKVKL